MLPLTTSTIVIQLQQFRYYVSLCTVQVHSEFKIKILDQNQVYCEDLRLLTLKTKIWHNNVLSRFWNNSTCILPEICHFWVQNIKLGKNRPRHYNGLEKMQLEPKFEVSSSKNKKSVQQSVFQKIWKIALLNNEICSIFPINYLVFYVVDQNFDFLRKTDRFWANILYVLEFLLAESLQKTCLYVLEKLQRNPSVGSCLKFFIF